MAWKVSREGEKSFDIFPFGGLAAFRAIFSALLGSPF